MNDYPEVTVKSRLPERIMVWLLCGAIAFCVLDILVAFWLLAFIRFGA